MNEVVLGYDAREPATDVARDWTPERRAGFLLRRDVRRPLSTDRLVWGLWHCFPGSDHYNGVQYEPYPWTDLAAMRAEIESVRCGERGPTEMAISLVVEDGVEVDRVLADEWADWVAPEALGVVQGQWRRAGYDVSDGAFLSGLMNCGYTEEDRLEELRRVWADRLNAHGLFSSVRDALGFRPLTDARVREHAPFYVFGVYLIEG
jgi:hypothetical protein